MFLPINGRLGSKDLMSELTNQNELIIKNIRFQMKIFVSGMDVKYSCM